ncbi:hypothetical protein GCE9029_03574 [Grimontia celer]|uniref:Uncharacterized protein n=1 Tax=Grimontia celer TaxID=1796497 RepID=A0A128F860_9GAMM|nr:hypothetical protein GCE9029_03574 [Grimontia celer]
MMKKVNFVAKKGPVLATKSKPHKPGPNPGPNPGPCCTP